MEMTPGLLARLGAPRRPPAAGLAYGEALVRSAEHRSGRADGDAIPETAGRAFADVAHEARRLLGHHGGGRSVRDHRSALAAASTARSASMARYDALENF